jgi:hypothetical protein
VKPDGSTPTDGDLLTIVTSEFLAQGGDEFWGEGATQGGVSVSDALMRDVLEQQLRGKSVLEEKSYFDRARRRIAFPAGKRRPVVCER